MDLLLFVCFCDVYVVVILLGYVYFQRCLSHSFSVDRSDVLLFHFWIFNYYYSEPMAFITTTSHSSLTFSFYSRMHLFWLRVVLLVYWLVLCPFHSMLLSLFLLVFIQEIWYDWKWTSRCTRAAWILVTSTFIWYQFNSRSWIQASSNNNKNKSRTIAFQEH